MLLRLSQGIAAIAAAVVVACWGWVWVLQNKAYDTVLEGCESRPWMLPNPGHPPCPAQWLVIESWGAIAIGFLVTGLCAMYMFRKR